MERAEARNALECVLNLATAVKETGCVTFFPGLQGSPRVFYDAQAGALPGRNAVSDLVFARTSRTIHR